jgi:hypothetical protein
MIIINVEEWSNWEKHNRDGGYGEAVLDFAEKWADLMEIRIGNGEELESVAKETSFQASKELGLSGFQYNAGVVMLVGCWKYGEELRIWHNLDTQISDEGERANESGGVLNGAILNLKRKT